MFFKKKELSISEIAEELLASDATLKEMWENDRMEFELRMELIKIREAKGLSQSELAEKSGCSGQIISSIECRANNSILKTICNLLKALDYEIQFVPRQH